MTVPSGVVLERDPLLELELDWLCADELAC